METKQELRKEILQIRDEITCEERKEKSREIAERVIHHHAFQESDIILLFASYKSEVDTTELHKAAQLLSKAIYYPKVVGEELAFYQVKELADLKEGYRGIREPEAVPEKKFRPQENEKICIIMPGAVFDEEGNRIGYGGGYYDKFLQKIKGDISSQNICRMAVAFQCQVVEAGYISVEEHDIKADFVVTERGCFGC